ncbi:uncharacterized protein AB675_2422 [Cyphellophora attinorum]|uniref:DJ-1/PfpI domain-containing protein n=1 Tax=Cyphellophora attinorum TaxID=1664694 RepID=A0A0N0NRB1_9EURO|nr:uncharacterized protein AB675_2422 [Phialophora attinorum]KPI44888.1 hypothetical protein AB675_2422 [Phialophora attinorum]
MAPQQVPRDRPIEVGALLFDYQASTSHAQPRPAHSFSYARLPILAYSLNICLWLTLVLRLVKQQGFTPIADSTIAAAPTFNFHHIAAASSFNNLAPVPMLTSQFIFYPTCTTATLPVELDYLVVGGPNPAAFTPDPAHVDFIRKHVAAGKTLFTTCTGIYVVACTGVLDGREATINNQEFYWVKERFPNVKWRKDKKWVVDEGKDGQGTIWTGSGAVAGIDMIASWIKQEFGVEVLMQGAAGLDYEPRDIDGFANEVFPKRLQEGTGRVMGAHVYP